ncbi:conserved hypothetical protein [Edwardsiella phage PEi26]|uniref:Uncharacterized protein n=1 Tax=Edwardsiella phage PEi26 TaxID=1608311 RepID=A0A0B6VRJ0_9CAUD|nr:conserved hypothetical protein [Edwardsiella phage PEi26]
MCTFCFYKDPDTGFFKFIKFRRDQRTSDRFYQSFDHALEEIASANGGDIMALRRMKQYNPQELNAVIKAMKEEWYK